MTRAASRPRWQLSDSADAVVLCLGEAAAMSGEAAIARASGATRPPAAVGGSGVAACRLEGGSP